MNPYHEWEAPGDGGCCGMFRGVRQVYDADGLRLY